MLFLALSTCLQTPDPKPQPHLSKPDMRVFPTPRHVFYTRIPLTSITSIRKSSNAALESYLHKKLTSRAPNIIFDYLSPTPSHLLNVTLADFLPDSCYPPGFSRENLRLPALENPDGDPVSLPQGHHLVYFSPQVPSSNLLSDGTDPLQSPGEPYVRRMWAGGSLHFDKRSTNQLATNNQRVCCTEIISDVSVKGIEGEEKVFVSIQRRIGNLSETTYPSTTHNRASSDPEKDYSVKANREDDISQWAMMEDRNLVFMRQKSAADAKEDAARLGKILKRMLISTIPPSTLLLHSG